MNKKQLISELSKQKKLLGKGWKSELKDRYPEIDGSGGYNCSIQKNILYIGCDLENSKFYATCEPYDGFTAYGDNAKEALEELVYILSREKERSEQRFKEIDEKLVEIKKML